MATQLISYKKYIRPKQQRNPTTKSQHIQSQKIQYNDLWSHPCLVFVSALTTSAFVIASSNPLKVLNQIMNAGSRPKLSAGILSDSLFLQETLHLEHCIKSSAYGWFPTKPLVDDISCLKCLQFKSGALVIFHFRYLIRD